MKLQQYHKIGRLRMNIAKTIGRKAADIYIDDNHLKHIELRHGKDVEAVGLNTISFVRSVIANYNEIRKGSGNSLLIIISNNKSKIVAVELNLSYRKGFYEVKTAQIRNNNKIKNKELLWAKYPISQ